MAVVTSSFSYDTEATRVVFGAGSISSLPDELRLRSSHFVLVGTPGRSGHLERVRGILGASVTGVFDQARVHVPAAVLRDALDLVRRNSADSVIAVGGGSAIGLAKGIARETGIPVVAVPTTYSGSEMTSIWGVADGETKRTGRDPRVLPVLAIYDPVLTLSLPPQVSAASGLNAVAHCVEALYAPDASPMSNMLAVEALGLLARALPAVVERPEDLSARSDALFGAHFAGYALELTAMGLQHKLAHVLGGLGLPHALTHAILLPHVMEFNAPAAVEAMAQVAAVLKGDAVPGVRSLVETLGISQRLRDVGLKKGDFDRVAALATEVTYPNPREVTPAAVKEILESAW